MPEIQWETITNTELVIATLYGGPGVSVQTISGPAAEVGWPGDYYKDYGPVPYALASITPRTLVSLRQPIGPVPPPPALPITTVFAINGSSFGGTIGSILAAALTPTETTPLRSVISLPLGPQQNALAAYQKALPPNVETFEQLPIYLYVLCFGAGSDDNTVPGETILRYQVNSNPPYQPAGLPGNSTGPTDPTFLAANSTVQGVSVLTTGALIQGLACKNDGTLAVADGQVIWLFDAETAAFKGAGTIDLTGSTFAAFTLAFGPDGNLYVLAGPPLGSPAENQPDSVSILKFLSPTWAPLGTGPDGPVLITSAQLTSTNVAMTVGGTSVAPIVYLSSNDQYGYGIVLTFDGITGKAIANTFQSLGDGQQVVSLAIVNYETEKGEITEPI
jgi:hypothetical protein